MLKHFFVGVAFTLSFFEGLRASSSSSGLDLAKRIPDSRTLFPVSKRTLGLRSRDLVRRALHPQDEVVLSYGEDFHSSQEHIFVVDVTFITHESLSIVVLEDFEELASSITCVDGSITITFSDNSDIDFTRDAWSDLNEFILVTSHAPSGCNPTDERGAYLVKHMHCDRLLSTVEFFAEPLVLLDAARRISVDFGHIPQEQFHRTLTKRQTTAEEIAEDQDDDTLNFHLDSTISLKTDLPPRITLPVSEIIEIASSVGGNGGSGDSGDNGAAGNDGTSLIVPEVQVSCIDCFVDGELVVRGHFDQDLGLSDLDEFQWAWVEVEATKPIKTQLKLEFFVGLSIEKEWKLRLIPTPLSLSPFQIPGLFSIGPEFDYQLITKLVFGGVEFNFTYGVTIEVPVDSVAHLDIKESNNSFARGWDKTDVNEIPFSVNTLGGDLALNISVTAQPSVGFKITLAAGGASVGPSIDFSAPKYMVAAKQLRNVTNDCTELGPNDYEYYDHAIQFSSNWELGVSASVSAELDLPFLPDFEAGWSIDIYTHTFDPDLTCLAFGDNGTTGELKPASSVEPQIDVAKVQQEVDRTGALPTGVDPSQLATYTMAGPLPTNVRAAVDDAEGGSARTKAEGGFWVLGFVVFATAASIIL